MTMDAEPTISEIREAAGRIRPYAHRTPVLTCAGLDEMTGARLFFKCENFQKVGAFKFRGACNAVMSLTDGEAARGVATHSSGNHAAALALAARLRGTAAHVVMPRTAPRVKRDAVAGYGARIVPCEPTLDSREETLSKVVGETGAEVIHPYDDYRVIAGQGTAALELLEDHPGLDVVMTPVGGGGLMSGTCLVAAALSPRTRLVGAEPEGADDAFRSLAEGRIVPSVDPKTVADGLLTSLGEKTFPILRRCLERIVTVSDAAILDALRHVFQRMKIVVEPSAVVTLGALLERKIDLRGLDVGIILTGGNVDLAALGASIARATPGP